MKVRAGDQKVYQWCYKLFLYKYLYQNASWDDCLIRKYYVVGYKYLLLILWFLLKKVYFVQNGIFNI